MIISVIGVLDLWSRARAQGTPTVTAAQAHLHEDLVRPGHIFIIDTGTAGSAGHVGLVEAVVAGKLVTIGGNTNHGGSQEGVGVFRREGRRVRDINVGFIDYGKA